MPTKPTDTFTWAKLANYVTGPFIGSPTKVLDPNAENEGAVPGEEIISEYVNLPLNITGQWITDWLEQGSSAADLDAHIIETDSDGVSNIASLNLGGTLSTDSPLSVNENNTNVLINATNNGPGFGIVCQVAGDLAAYRGLSFSNTGPIFDAVGFGSGIGVKSRVNTGYAFQGDVTSGVAGNFTATSGIGLGASATTGVGASISATGALPALLVTQTSATTPAAISATAGLASAVKGTASGGIGIEGVDTSGTGGKFTVTSGTGVDVNATTGIAVDAFSTSNDALRGVSTSGTGGRVSSSSGTALVAVSTSGVGASIASGSNYPLVLTGDTTTPAKAQLRIVPATPKPSTLQAGDVFICDNFPNFYNLGYARAPDDVDEPQFVWSTKGGFNSLMKREPGLLPVILASSEDVDIDLQYEQPYGDPVGGFIEITLAIRASSVLGAGPHELTITWDVDGSPTSEIIVVGAMGAGASQGPLMTWFHQFRTNISKFEQIPVNLKIENTSAIGNSIWIRHYSIKIDGVYESGD